MQAKESRRVERKKAASKRKVITAAVELFNQHGVDNVTMEQIAEAADISRGTLYNYFPSKDAVVNAYLQQTFQDRSTDRLAQLNSCLAPAPAWSTCLASWLKVSSGRNRSLRSSWFTA